MEGESKPDIHWEPIKIPEEKKSKEADGLSPEKKMWIGLLDEARSNIEEIIRNEPGINPEEAELGIDETHLDLESKKFQTGSFAFWGGLAGKLSFPELATSQDKIPVIKNIRIPSPMRGGGLGTRLVEAWEEAFSKFNVNTFVVTNLDEVDQDSVRFWKKRGYQIPPEEMKKKAPYYMYKRVRKG